MNYLLLDPVVDAINTAVNSIIQWFYGLLFKILMYIKEVFDFCYMLVRKLAGIDTYYYNGQLMGAGEATSNTVTGDIVEVLLKTDIIRNLFITLLVLGVILLLIITFICVWKTEWEFGKDQNSKTKIFNSVLRALFNFIAVPVITFFGIFVGNALLRAIDDATAGGTNVKMSDIVMTSIATNALRADHQGNSFNYDFISKNNTFDETNQKMGIYQYFMNSKGEIVSADILSAFKNNSTLKDKGVYYVNTTDSGLDAKGVNEKLENGTLVFSFTDAQIVDVFFDKGEFNYVLGYLVLIIMLKTMLEITFGLVKRLFYIVFLFVVSPPIVAMTPLNDKPLSKWREAFVGHFCSAFVTVAFFNIFMSIYPLFERISLFPANQTYSILNGFVSLLMVCVGLLVINEIIKLVSEIIFGKGYDAITQSSGGWGSAFGMAGQALRPMALPGRIVGKGAEIFNRARYEGLGSAVRHVGTDLRGVARNVANTGPLAQMWQRANLGRATQGFRTARQIRNDTGATDIIRGRRESGRMIRGDIRENQQALVGTANERLRREGLNAYAQRLRNNIAGDADRMAYSTHQTNLANAQGIIDGATEQVRNTSSRYSSATDRQIRRYLRSNPTLANEVIAYRNASATVPAEQAAMDALTARHAEWQNEDAFLQAYDDRRALRRSNASNIVRTERGVLSPTSRRNSVRVRRTNAQTARDVIARRTAQSDARRNTTP